MERSQSTPDILGDVESSSQSGIETGTGAGGKMSGSWSKNRPGGNPVQYASALQASTGSDATKLMGAMSAGNFKVRYQVLKMPRTTLLNGPRFINCAFLLLWFL